MLELLRSKRLWILLSRFKGWVKNK
uniref:Uncharacterized protein n=1 Tax=Medicago truncatula TaxID=3880 RepID=I3T704_MEDTR|nr:unknown [Medicago truncatula]